MEEIKYQKEELKLPIIYSTNQMKLKSSTTNYNANNNLVNIINNSLSKFEKLNNNKDSKCYKLLFPENKNNDFIVGKYSVNKENEKKRINSEEIQLFKYNSVSKLEKKIYENKYSKENYQYKNKNQFINDFIFKNGNLINSYTKKSKIIEICPLCNKEIESKRIASHIKLHPSKIFDWLYLGNYRNSKDINGLKDLKINYILNCASECKFKNDLPSDIKCLHIKVKDIPYINISSYFEDTNDFIHKAKLSGGKILVHCFLGSSRSSTFVIAYMIKYMGYTTMNALYYLKDKRPIVMPNTGFLMQLQKYESKIKNI